MRTRLLFAAAAAVVAGLVGLSAWLFRWSLGEAAVLAPIIVATAGATAFLFVLWTRVAVESLRRSGHPLAIVSGLVGAFALLVVVSVVVTN